MQLAYLGFGRPGVSCLVTTFCHIQLICSVKTTDPLSSLAWEVRSRTKIFRFGLRRWRSRTANGLNYWPPTARESRGSETTKPHGTEKMCVLLKTTTPAKSVNSLKAQNPPTNVPLRAQGIFRYSARVYSRILHCGSSFRLPGCYFFAAGFEK